MSSVQTEQCVLCSSLSTGSIAVESSRYFKCERCGLIFLDPQQRLSPPEELARYQTHQNDPKDIGYRAFLSQLLEPMLPLLPTRGRGLDFGCGPGPALAMMLEEQGYAMSLFDPFFRNDPAVLDTRYDFIVCTETAEHFYHPLEEFRLLTELLNPGGLLGIMTLFFEENEDFAAWWYRKDPTHVCFYCKRTIDWLASYFGWTVLHREARSAIIRK